MAKKRKTKKQKAKKKTRAVVAKKRRKTPAVAAKKQGRKTQPVARKKKTDEPRFVTDADAERLRHAQPSGSYVLAEEGTKPLVQRTRTAQADDV